MKISLTQTRSNLGKSALIRTSTGSALRCNLQEAHAEAERTGGVGSNIGVENFEGKVKPRRTSSGPPCSTKPLDNRLVDTFLSIFIESNQLNNEILVTSSVEIHSVCPKKYSLSISNT